MSRVLNTMKLDATVQIRNNLYAIGIGVGLLVAVIISQLIGAEQLPRAVPVLMLLIVGGTTLLYIAGMIIFEKDEGTINAVIVSPLKTSEYLWSKIITLTALATLESVIMIGGAFAISFLFGNTLTLPNIPLLLLGIIALAVIYTLFGIVMIVRYNKITDFLVPVVVFAAVAQLPFLHFMGMIEHPLFLVIPTSAPTMLMQGAFQSLTSLEWAYAFGYTAVTVIVLSVWAYRAFHSHIVMKVG